MMPFLPSRRGLYLANIRLNFPTVGLRFKRCLRTVSGPMSIPADSFPVGVLLSTAPSVLAVVLFFGPARSVQEMIANGSHNNKLPLLPYLSMLLQSLTWCLYGILDDSATIYLPNLIGCFLGFAYTCAYISLSTKRRELCLSQVVAATALAFLLWVYVRFPAETATGILGILACTGSVIFMGSPLVKLWEVYKTKSVETMPYEVSVLVFANGTAWTLYGMLILLCSCVSEYSLSR